MLGRLALVLLLTFAPALNLAAPVAPRASLPVATSMQDMARADAAMAPSEPCTHANIVTKDDGVACGAGDHADTAHHAKPICLQCVAFGSPGLAGAPDVAAIVAPTAAVSAYPCNPNSLAASRDDAANFCRGPPHAV